MEDKNERTRLGWQIAILDNVIQFYRVKGQVFELPDLEYQKASHERRLAIINDRMGPINPRNSS